MSKLDKNILMKAFETKRGSVIFESRKRNFSAPEAMEIFNLFVIGLDILIAGCKR